MFPFNNLVRCGAHMIVSAHPSLCALELVEANRTSVKSEHDKLLEIMSANGMRDKISRREVAGLDMDNLVLLERQIVDLSEKYQNSSCFIEFAAEQQVLAEKYGLCVVDNIGMVKWRMNAFWNRLFRTLGISASLGDQLNPKLLNILYATTPFVRSRMIFANNRDFWIEIERIPYALLALYAIVAIGHDAGIERATFQTVSRMLREYKSLLRLLAYLDCAMSWRTDVLMDFPECERNSDRLIYIGIIKALLPSRQRVAKSMLGNILLDNLPDCEVDRIILLKGIAHMLQGKIAALDSHSMASPKARRRLRSAAQRWVVGKFSREDLGRAFAWRDVRRKRMPKSVNACG
jgi:hypothetical protein